MLKRNVVSADPIRMYSYREIVDYVQMSVDLDHVLKLRTGDYLHQTSTPIERFPFSQTK